MYGVDGGLCFVHLAVALVSYGYLCSTFVYVRDMCVTTSMFAYIYHMYVHLRAYFGLCLASLI